MNTIIDKIDLWTTAQELKTSNRGRSASNQSLLGIKKLRELILELAVRGKLVQQDPNDEPASELLKQIAKEKARLVKDGKIKKQVTSLKIEEYEKPFDLPNGWSYVRSEVLFSLRKGKKPKNLSEENIGLPYLDIAALDKGIISQFTNDNNCPQATDEDILIVCDGSRSGLLLDGKNGIVGSTLAVIDTVPIIKPYLKILFAKSFNHLNSTMKGAAIPHLDTRKLLESVVAIPPHSEQKYILAKVDELMALCDELEKQQTNSNVAHETLVATLLGSLTDIENSKYFDESWQRIANHFDILFTTEHSIDQLKQTILQLAVMGKMETQRDEDESASKLLKKIAKEKAKLIKEGKIKSEINLPSITNEELHYDLPKNWIWCRMQDLCPNISSGSTPENKYFIESGIPFLKVYNIRDQKIDFNFKEQFIDQEIHSSKLKRSILKPGDVIMNIVGPPLGKIAIVPDNYEEWNCNQAIVFFKPVVKELNQWLYTFLCAGSFLNDIELIGTAGQDNISVTKSKNIIIPLPPLAEQYRIVSKVNELFALCDGLKERLVKAQTLQNQLAATVVERALN